MGNHQNTSKCCLMKTSKSCNKRELKPCEPVLIRVIWHALSQVFHINLKQDTEEWIQTKNSPECGTAQFDRCKSLCHVISCPCKKQLYCFVFATLLLWKGGEKTTYQGNELSQQDVAQQPFSVFFFFQTNMLATFHLFHLHLEILDSCWRCTLSELERGWHFIIL